MSVAWTSTVVSATERVLLMLGWERAVQKTEVYDAGRKKPFAARTKSYNNLQETVRSRNTTSSWEREKPSLKLRAVNPEVQRRSAPAQTWTSSAFDVASNTGTV